MSTGEITLYIATSVDDFIAPKEGRVEWLDESRAETNDNTDTGRYQEFFAGIDCLVVGSKTYEQIRGFGDWPYEQKPTYVVTSRKLPLATESVELFDGEVTELAEQVKRRYEHVWLVGGAQLAQAFLSVNQIDKLRLSLVPVLLGSGIRLFENANDAHNLTLLDTVPSESGIVELHYRVT